MLALGIIAMASLGLAGMMGSSGAEDSETDDMTIDDPSALGPDAETATEVEVTVEATQPTAEVETTQPVTGVEEEATQSSTTVQDTSLQDTPAPRVFTPPPHIPTPVLTLSQMVAVETSEGVEISDDLVLTEGPDTGENQDRSYLIQPPETAHSIDLGYHSETTFSVTPNNQTTHISASLNTNITSGESTDILTTENKVDAQGNFFEETIVTKEYANDVSIVLNVDQSQVGSHVAEIDLSNPEDTLRFEFSNIHGFMHLITNEQETEDGDDSITQTTRTLYVIETPLDVRELSPDEIDNIIAGDGAINSQTQLVAEVHLGTSSLHLEAASGENGISAQTIANNMNDSPHISTNFYWASEGEHDGGAMPQENGPVAQVGVVTQIDPTASDQDQTATPATPSTGTNTSQVTPAVTTPQIEEETTTSDDTSTTTTVGLTTLTAEQAEIELERANNLLDQAQDGLRDLNIPGLNVNTAFPSYLNY
jgi:hypothetical protein